MYIYIFYFFGFIIPMLPIFQEELTSLFFKYFYCSN